MTKDATTGYRKLDFRNHRLPCNETILELLLAKIYQSLPGTQLTERNAGIDVIRGICILFVIFLHVNIHFGLTGSFLAEMLPKRIFSLFFWSGYYGVVIFFTLSGYLITNSILMKWGSLDKINLQTFYWYRFSRIIPLLLCLLVILSVLHLVYVPGFTIDHQQTSLLRAFFSALTFHINWLQIQVGYLPANWDILWSIAIEETFYLVFPLLCLLMRRPWPLMLLVLIFLIVSPWARTGLYPENELGDRNHLAYLDSLALGCLTALIASRFEMPKWLSRLQFIVGLSMVTLILYFRSVVYQGGLTTIGVNVTILSLGVACILFWLHEHHRAHRATGHWSYRWLQHMGAYSYEIYLTHMFVVLAAASTFRYFQCSQGWLLPFILATLLISYLLGKLVFGYFSEPLNRYLRKRWRNQ